MGFPTHEALNANTGFLMRKISMVSFEAFAAATAEYGLHPMHFGMLQILDAEEPISQQELGKRAGVDPSTMVARMDVLDENGLVERTRSPDDRRSYQIRLSPKGREALVKLRGVSETHVQRIYGVLTEEERATLQELLLKLSANVDALREDRSPPRRSPAEA
jgi:DNA-binding MarR family transcriptional regulator